MKPCGCNKLKEISSTQLEELKSRGYDVVVNEDGSVSIAGHSKFKLVDEQTSTGNVAGYNTPNAFSKTKDTPDKDEEMAKKAHGTVARSITEAMSKDAIFKVYNTLKRGDKVTIYSEDGYSGKKERKFIVSKGKSIVGKRGGTGGVERITLAFDIPDGRHRVKCFLYNRDGSISFAIGDAAARILDIKKTMNESAEVELSPKQRINKSLREVSSSLLRVERELSKIKRLKTENSHDNSIFLARTKDRIRKINERSLKINRLMKDIMSERYNEGISYDVEKMRKLVESDLFIKSYYKIIEASGERMKRIFETVVKGDPVMEEKYMRG